MKTFFLQLYRFMYCNHTSNRQNTNRKKKRFSFLLKIVLLFISETKPWNISDISENVFSAVVKESKKALQRLQCQSAQQLWSAFFHLCIGPFLCFLLWHAYNATCRHICWHALACVRAFTQTHSPSCARTECLTALWPASQWTIIIFCRGSHRTDCQLSKFQQLKSSAQWKCEHSIFAILHS